MEQKKIKRRIQAYLWEFLVGLLEDEECAPFINWTNKFEKEFVVVDPDEVASLWGLLKNRPNMNKTKLRRAIRQYYKRDLIMKVGICLFLLCPRLFMTPQLTVTDAGNRVICIDLHKLN